MDYLLSTIAFTAVALLVFTLFGGAMAFVIGLTMFAPILVAASIVAFWPFYLGLQANHGYTKSCHLMCRILGVINPIAFIAYCILVNNDFLQAFAVLFVVMTICGVIVSRFKQSFVLDEAI